MTHTHTCEFVVSGHFAEHIITHKASSSQQTSQCVRVRRAMRCCCTAQHHPQHGVCTHRTDPPCARVCFFPRNVFRVCVCVCQQRVTHGGPACVSHSMQNATSTTKRAPHPHHIYSRRIISCCLLKCCFFTNMGVNFQARLLMCVWVCVPDM
jgi:hypothetical protein